MPQTRSGTAAAESATAAPPRKATLLLLVLLSAPFMASVDATIANVATPAIHARLGVSGPGLVLVIDGYLATYAMLLITGARLGHIHGLRRAFTAGSAVFTAASLLAGLAPDPAALVLARVVQGMGAAVMFPQALTGVQVLFTGPARARAIGYYAAALSAGAVAGQLCGGLLVSADVLGLGWRSVFLVNVPVGAGMAAAAAWLLPGDAPRRRARLDLPGVATLSAAVAAIILPLAQGPAARWPAWTWLCLAASLPALGLFVLTQRRLESAGGDPLVNLRVIAGRPVAPGLAALTAASGTYFALLFTLAQYLQQGLGRSPLVSGLVLVPWVAAFGAAGQVVRRLPAAVAPAVPAGGCLLLAAAYTAVSVSLLAGWRSLALLTAILAVGGLGLGIQFAAMLGRLADAAGPAHAADISGAASTMTQVGGALAVAGFGSLYLSLAHGAGGGHSGAERGFAVTAAALAAAALAAAVLSHQATRRPGRAAGAAPAHKSDHASAQGSGLEALQPPHKHALGPADAQERG